MNFHKKNVMCRFSIGGTVSKSPGLIFTLSWKELSLFQVFRMGWSCAHQSHNVEVSFYARLCYLPNMLYSCIILTSHKFYYQIIDMET